MKKLALAVIFLCMLAGPVMCALPDWVDTMPSGTSTFTVRTTAEKAVSENEFTAQSIVTDTQAFSGTIATTGVTPYGADYTLVADETMDIQQNTNTWAFGAQNNPGDQQYLYQTAVGQIITRPDYADPEELTITNPVTMQIDKAAEAAISIDLEPVTITDEHYGKGVSLTITPQWGMTTQDCSQLSVDANKEDNPIIGEGADFPLEFECVDCEIPVVDTTDLTLVESGFQEAGIQLVGDPTCIGCSDSEMPTGSVAAFMVKYPEGQQEVIEDGSWLESHLLGTWVNGEEELALYGSEPAVEFMSPYVLQLQDTNLEGGVVHMGELNAWAKSSNSLDLIEMHIPMYGTAEIVYLDGNSEGGATYDLVTVPEGIGVLAYHQGGSVGQYWWNSEPEY